MSSIGIRQREGSAWLLPAIAALALLAATLQAEDPTGKALLNRATGLLNTGQAAEAEALLQRAIAQDGPNVETLLRLGIAQSVQNKYGESEAAFRQALELAPREPRLLHNLGLLFLRQERYDEALDHFHQALEVRSWHPQSNFYIGVIHQRRGNQEEALRYYIEELNVNPANPSAWRQYYQLRQAQRGLSDGAAGKEKEFPWTMVAIWLVVLAASATFYWLKKAYWDMEDSPGFASELEGTEDRQRLFARRGEEEDRARPSEKSSPR